MAEVTVTVPQRGGEIVIATDGDAPRHYAVTDGRIVVDDLALQGVLSGVPGSAVAEDAAPASPSSGTTSATSSSSAGASGTTPSASASASK